MNHHRKRGRRNRRAFTLAELLVVIVVLGIIGSVAIAIIAGIRFQAAESQTRFNAKTLTRVLNSALEAGVTPASLQLTGANPDPSPVLSALRDSVRADDTNIVFGLEEERVNSVLEEIASGASTYTITFDTNSDIATVVGTRNF